MQKYTYKNKSLVHKKAFTLIELLIVIAIIGILFIVLVSKVDFATDKAKATGVQTDFRSFQMAFDTVAKEHAGFNTFGYNTGDNAGGVTTEGGAITLDGKAYTHTNALKDLGDGKRNSYDVGDDNLDGIQNGSEVWTGRKVYTETFTNVYTLVKPGTSVLDTTVLAKLETAINANLDPKLHITIGSDGKITMANGAQDPWNNEYHGAYITNAHIDGKDRGAIVMYSDGANGKFGSEHTISNGIVSISIPGSNQNGKDDYALVSVYTYLNGYGEIKNVTAGFSNNQTMGGNNVLGSNQDDVTPDTPNIPDTPEQDNGLQRNTEYVFRTDLTCHELAELYALSTSVVNDNDIGTATFFNNENVELVIMYTNGLYGIGYRDYHTYYMYYTQEIFESGGSTVQGWVLMDTMESCETPIMYFDDDCIITSVNGLQDLKPFFDLHEDLNGCVCSKCGETYHDFVNGTCSRCGYIDK